MVAITTRRTACPIPIWVPESIVISPPPKSANPVTAPTSETHKVATREKIVMAANFTASSLVRCTGTVSRYRNVPILASPATESPEMAATASGRNRPSSMPSAASATNSPLEVIESKKSGPRPCLGFESLTVIAIMSGTSARIPIPAWVRRRPKTSRSSERRKRVETCRRGRAARDVGNTVARPLSGPLSRPGGRSAADIEALPRQRNEQILQARTFDRKPGDRHIVLHQCHHDLLSRQFAQTGYSQTGFDHNIGQPESSQHPGRSLRTVSDDPGPRLTHGSHLCDRALRQQLAHMHHPDMGAHLLNLRQQMAGDQHRGAVVG